MEVGVLVSFSFSFSYFFSSAERDRETDRECGNVNLFGSKRNEFEILREVQGMVSVERGTSLTNQSCRLV